MDQKTLAALIKRYKSGEATPDEIAMLEKIWRRSGTDISFKSDHTDVELENIGRKMFKDIKSEILKHERQVIKPLRSGRSLYQVAATLLILVSVSLWWYANASDVIKIRTGFGERRTVMLPD